MTSIRRELAGCWAGCFKERENWALLVSRVLKHSPRGAVVGRALAESV